MAQVNNAAAQKKWESLKGSAGVSLSRIVQGNATSADYQRVMNVLNQQSNLASQVFGQLLALAKANAEKSKDNYEALLDKNNEVLLSAFEVAFNEELKKIEPDIVGQLKEIIEMTVLQSNEDLDQRMGSRFDAIKDLLPAKKDNPSINDLLAANDLLAERVQEDNAAEWDRRLPSLIERVAQTFEGTLRNLAERINAEKAHRAQTARGHAASHPSASVPLLSHGPSPVATMERQSILQQGMALLRGPSSGNALTVGKSPASGVSGSTDSTTAVVALSPAAQHDLTTAADSQKGFYDRIKALLPSHAKKEDTGEAQQQDDESKKADTWWRSFKNWFGDDESKRQSKKKDRFSWLKGLGQMLALMILNPKLFQTLGEGMKNLLTWDNIKGAAEKSWDWVKGVASSVMETISNMLGGTMKTPTQQEVTASKDGGQNLATTKNVAGDTKHADINNLTPEQKKQFDSFGKANKESSEGPGVLNTFLSKIGITTPRMKDYMAANTDTNPNSPTYGHVIINGKDQGPNKDFSTTAVSSAGTGRSSLGVKAPLPANMPTGAAGAVTFSESPSLPMTPGVALPTVDATHMYVGSGSTQPQRGAQQIGIGSFGFTASNSDSLTLMNTTHFTAG